MKEAAVQRKHNLYRDSIVMRSSDPNLHLLGEGTPIDWGEEYGGQADTDPSGEKLRRAKQVVSVIQLDEAALPYAVTALEGSQDASPEEPSGAPSPPPQSPPDSVKELRGLWVKEGRVDAGEKGEEPLSNGTVVQVVQESHGTLERTEEEEEEAEIPLAPPAADARLVEQPAASAEEEVPPPAPASPAKPPSPAAVREAPADSPEPSDKETGEETAAAVAAPACEEPAKDDSAGLQTQF